MKYIKRILIILILAVCVIYTYSFVRNGVEIELEQKEDMQKEQVKQEIENIPAVQEIEKEIPDVDVWEKIRLTYHGGMQGLIIHESSETVFQTNWNYRVKEVTVTKEFDEKWDEIPDYSEYDTDKEGNFLNEYSYVAIAVEIECVQEGIQELYLNNMWLQIFDEKGVHIGGAEAWTADLGNSATKSYFGCSLKEGEVLNAEVVYVVPDECLREDFYYMMEVDNQGVEPSETADLALIKLPYGVELKDDKE